MKKIRKTLKAIKEILKNPWLLNKILSDDQVWMDYVNKNHKIKIGLPVVELDQVIPGFDETLETFAFLDGGSLPTDIALLKGLSKNISDCTYFEIGTWRGESIVNVHTHCKEAYTFNLSREEIISSGLNPAYAELHGFFSKKFPNILHLEGNSINYDFASLNKKFDLIFIDGDHHYEFVKNDTEKIFKHLVHENSIVIWHDYTHSPTEIRYEVLAGIMDGIPSDYKENLYHVSNTMCAMFTKKKFNTFQLTNPKTPTRTFRIHISSQKI